MLSNYCTETLFCNFVLQVKQEYWQKNMAFDLEFITEKYSETTVLAISPKIVNQVTAKKLARKQM